MSSTEQHVYLYQYLMLCHLSLLTMCPLIQNQFYWLCHLSLGSNFFPFPWIVTYKALQRLELYPLILSSDDAGMTQALAHTCSLVCYTKSHHSFLCLYSAISHITRGPCRHGQSNQPSVCHFKKIFPSSQYIPVQ